MNIDDKIKSIKKQVREINADIQERSQNKDDFFMLDDFVNCVETNLDLMVLYSDET